MSAATAIRPSGKLSAKAPTAVVRNAVSLRDLRAYFRAEHRMSKRKARDMAHKVYEDEPAAREYLPEVWYQEIHGKTSGFVRRSPGVSDPTPRDAIRNIEGDQA